jgi:hypothetical protein
VADGLDVSMEVTGLAEALKALAKTDPELRKAVIKDMKAAAAPLEQAARRDIPARPLNNWGNWKEGFDQTRVQRGIKAAFRGGRVKGKSGDHFPLLSLRQTNAAGAIYDMAGRAGGSGRGSEGGMRGAEMIRKLDQNGAASRSLWPAVERNFSEVEGALEKVVDSMSDVVNREILKRA